MSAPTTDTISRADVKNYKKALDTKLNALDRPLTIMKPRSAWHTAQHTTLSKQKSSLSDAVQQLDGLVGKPKDFPGLAKLVTAVDTLAAGVKTAFDTKVESTYYFGKDSVKDEAALVTEVKKVLPKQDEGHASQAVADAVSKSNPKDASVLGRGVKHASAGVTAKKTSCSVFFTRQDLNDGLEQRVTIVAVGGHTPKSGEYLIHDGLTSNKKQGDIVKL